MKRFLVLLVLTLSVMQFSYALDASTLPVISSGNVASSSNKSNNDINHSYGFQPPVYYRDDYYYGRNRYYYGRGYLPRRTVVTTYFTDPYYYSDRRYYGIICLDKKTGKTINCDRIRVKRSDYICIDKETEENVECPR